MRTDSNSNTDDFQGLARRALARRIRPLGGSADLASELFDLADRHQTRSKALVVFEAAWEATDPGEKSAEDERIYRRELARRRRAIGNIEKRSETLLERYKLDLMAALEIDSSLGEELDLV